MSRNLSVVEPHPSVPSKGGYVYGGRGGAGNYKHYSSSALTSGPTATGPPSRINLALSKLNKRQQTSSSQSTLLTSGRGGAGNMFKPSSSKEGEEERVFQFDEEMVRKRETQAVAPVYHFGRGGAANYVDESRPARTERMGSTASVLSSSSEGSTDGNANGNAKRLGALGKIARRFS